MPQWKEEAKRESDGNDEAEKSGSHGVADVAERDVSGYRSLTHTPPAYDKSESDGRSRRSRSLSEPPERKEEREDVAAW